MNEIVNSSSLVEQGEGEALTKAEPEPEQEDLSVSDIPDSIHQIQRVPPHLRNRKTHRGVYDPAVVSLGPYHHGKPQYRHAEVFKEVSLHEFLSNSCGKDKFFFHTKILERVQVLRACYEEVAYEDRALAWMMLYDACFFIHVLRTRTMKGSYWETKYDELVIHFGRCREAFIEQDMLRLENQIPFWVLKLLLSLQSGGGECSVLYKMVFELLGERCYVTFPWKDRVHDQEPFHFLDAKQFLLGRCIMLNTCSKDSNRHRIRDHVEKGSYQFRSIKNLKSKGIRFGVSNLFKGKPFISFISHSLWGQLNLPALRMGPHIFVIYSNIIAYEMSPNTCYITPYVTAYVNFMKSLIQSPADVKILREQGILLCDVASNGEMVKVFTDLDTFRTPGVDIFSEVYNDIVSHCSSTAKTWVAELVHSYFESPWTTIALLAAFFILCSTFLQTYYAIHPAN